MVESKASWCDRGFVRRGTSGLRRLWCAALITACGGAPKPAAPAPKASATPPVVASSKPPAPEPAAVELRTGKFAPTEGTPLELTFVARQLVGEDELFELSVPPLPLDADRSLIGFRSGVWVTIEAPAPATALFGAGDGGMHLWVRRPKSAAGAPAGTDTLRGVIYSASEPRDSVHDSVPGHRFPFTARLDGNAHPDPKLELTFFKEVAAVMRDRSGPFYAYAATKLAERAHAPQPKTAAAQRRDGDIQELSRLMDSMTGRLSLQEALQKDRAVRGRTAREKETVPIEKVQGPSLARHPWKLMRAALRQMPPAEPLAQATPAEFWYVRARDVGKLLDGIDLVEEWGQPAADLLDGRVQDRGTFERYQTELGLERTGLTRTFGPELIADLAIVGSDPYVNEGTDVTLLLHPKNEIALRAALAAVFTHVASTHGELTETTFTHEGVPVTVQRSSDGRVRRHLASSGGILILSNSAGAIRKVLSAAAGKAPRLADEDDFLYALARDVQPGIPPGDDVLAYVGDRFVASVVGPRQKIAQARRQLAFADLSAPGFAALLAGMVNGKSPATAAELTRDGWLSPTELRHADGGAIHFEPGSGAESKWGRVDRLEPLIDLPGPKALTATEADAYRRFAIEYENLWSEAIDPAVLRLAEAATNGKNELTADLRVLPLQVRNYRDEIEMAGKAVLTVPPLASGARFVIAIGKDARIRRELSQVGSELGPLADKLRFDWLGDYALVGVANRNELSNAVHTLLPREMEPPAANVDPATRAGNDELFDLLENLPLYAAIGIRSRVGAGIALNFLREQTEHEARGIARWSTAAPYRNNEVNRIDVRESGTTVSLFYTLIDRAIVFSLNESTLHSVVDELTAAPPLAREASDTAQGSQTMLELAGTPGSPLHRIGAWSGTYSLLDRMGWNTDLAEPVLRGAPEASQDPARVRALARTYFGTVPLTPEGREFTLTNEGIRDPVRGTPYALEWPALPVPGSPVDRVVSRLLNLRAGLSFDVEPVVENGERPLRSLHATVTVQLGARSPR